jgi:[ribosomal protein S5]-alanine N-acetyltransferase
MGMVMTNAGAEELLVLTTERLSLRKLTYNDAAFILELLNEKAFLRFIGDRGIRTLADARGYLEKGPLLSYERHGFGLWQVQLDSSKEPLGICGLIKRDALNDVDLGYAFLERHWSKGYASEAALAVKNYAVSVLGLHRLVAIVDPQNFSSMRVLKKAGLQYERMIKLSDDGEELKLFAVGVAD